MFDTGKTLGLIASALCTLLFTCLPGEALASQTSYAKTFGDRNATGEQLTTAFFELLTDTGSPAGIIGTTPEEDAASKEMVLPYIDQAFLLQRATGERYTSDNYMPADVDEFEISNIRVTQPANDIYVTRYDMKTSQSFSDSGVVMSEEKAPRLTVFRWDNTDSRWKIFSHGNFNTPVAAICNKAAIVNDALTSPASPEDHALGEKLMNNFYDLLVQGDTAPLLHPLIQYQSASGVGYTTLAERLSSSKTADAQLDSAIVTRNGNLLNVSAYHTTKERVLMGKHQLRAGKSAHLVTFLQDENGVWKMIAVSSFAPAATLPPGVQCIPVGKQRV